jgi:hypothetical protein
MPAIPISGKPNFGSTYSDQTKAMRTLVQHLAKQTFANGSFQAITNSTGGTTTGSIVAVPTPKTAGTTATDCALKTAFDTNLTAVNNAAHILIGVLNPMLTAVGAATLTNNTGGTGTAGTVPAISKTITAAAANTAVNYGDARSRLGQARNEQATIVRAVNSIAMAIGESSLSDNTGGNAATNLTVAALTATSAAVAGNANAPGCLKTEADAAFAALCDNYARVCAKITALDGIAAPTTMPVVAIA